MIILATLFIFLIVPTDVPPNFNSKKHKRYHEELYRVGAAKPLKGVFSDWDPYNFNPTFDMAEEVKKRISFGA